MFKMTSRLLGMALVLFLSVGLISCGSGGGGGGDGSAGATGPKVAVVADIAGDELASYLSSRGLKVDNFPGNLHSNYPDVSGDYVVWQDNRNGNWDIYAYKISEQREFRVTTDPADQTAPKVYNDSIIVWKDQRNAATNGQDIYAYDLTSDTEFPVVATIGSQSDFDASDTHIVWRDNRDWATTGSDIYAYRLSDGEEIPLAVGDHSEYNPRAHGDWVAWNEDRGIGLGGDNIYYYRISDGATGPATEGDYNRLYDIYDGRIVYLSYIAGVTGNEVYARDLAAGSTIALASYDGIYKCVPMIEGDYIVWQQHYGGGCDGGIFGYQISDVAGKPFTIAPQPVDRPDNMRSLGMDSNHVVWVNRGNIHVYDLVLGDEAPTIEPDDNPGNMVLSSGRIAWDGDPFGYDDVYLTPDLGTTISNITESKVTAADVDPSAYDVLLFGDGIRSSQFILSLFDAADAAGINMLGIGDEDNYPLGDILAGDNRFAMRTEYDSGASPMEIDVTAAGSGHAIFSGLDTASTLHLETPGGYMGEFVYYTDDPLVEGSPADWRVLARMGANMSLFGEPAIVEFTTPGGTRVLLDGSANTADFYNYWTEARWNLLYNEVMYLSE